MAAESVRQSVNTSNVLSIIMGGGQGTRLFPLTKERAKPAVPLAGKYRLVDIPISNCINSGLRRIYVLTQFNSASLHRHISQSYKFDHFTGGFVEILAAEQTFSDASWYQGTADAVRKNLIHMLNHEFEYLLILSGDQLYRMDFRTIIEQHAKTKADITIATIPVGRQEAEAFGIMHIDADRRITRFEEKPKTPELQDAMQLDRESYASLGITDDRQLFLASMGIYVFNRQVVVELLNNSFTDFGKHIIPNAIKTHRVFSYVYQVYWEDIGTIRAFFEANLDVTSELPRFNFFDMSAPVFSRPRFLPGSKINGAQIDHAVVSDGCIINHARIINSIIGVRSLVGAGSELKRVIALGCDFYESAASIRDSIAQGRPQIGIGQNTRIENAIIDKNARIGDGCELSPAGKTDGRYVDGAVIIRDGVLVVPKGAVLPAGTKL